MHTGNPARTRLSLLLIALMALPLLIGPGVSAQVATPADVLAPPLDQYVDMSVYCADLGTPAAAGVSAVASVEPWIYPIDDDKGVLLGEWDLPAGSHLTLSGEAALLTVEEGSVTVVSCGAPLQYATEPGPEPGILEETELPADMGLTVDASFAEGVAFSYKGHDGTVAIVAQGETDSRIALEVIGSVESEGICSSTDCWDWTDLAQDEVDAGGAGEATPAMTAIAAPGPRPGICGWIRC